MEIIDLGIYNSLKNDFGFNKVIESAKTVASYDKEEQLVFFDLRFREVAFDTELPEHAIPICVINVLS